MALAWQGVAATVSLDKFTWLTVDVDDQCLGTSQGGGTRWAVTMSSTNKDIVEDSHVVQTFYTGPQVSLKVNLNAQPLKLPLINPPL